MTQCNFVIRKQIMKDESSNHMTLFVNSTWLQPRPNEKKKTRDKKAGKRDRYWISSLEAYGVMRVNQKQTVSK